jgi:uncharacterized protein
MRPRSVWFALVLLFAHFVVMFGFGYAILIALGVDPRTIPEAPPLAFVALVLAAALDVGIVFVGLLGRFGGISLRELGWARILWRDIAVGLIVAAFTEETLFRGYMQPAVQHKLGRWSGLVVVALVFAAYHGRFAPTMFLGKLGVGLVLAGLRERTGTLWAAALAHVLQWAILCMT